MDEAALFKPILEIGIAGAIAFYLLSKTTEAIKELSNSIKDLAERFTKLDSRISTFENDIKEIKFTLREMEKSATRQNLRD